MKPSCYYGNSGSCEGFESWGGCLRDGNCGVGEVVRVVGVVKVVRVVGVVGVVRVV